MVSALKNSAIWLLVMAVAMVGSASAQAIQGTDTGFGGVNSITGTVLSPSGQRMERRVSVRLNTMEKGDRVSMTDDSGNFAFRGLPNGDYQLVIDKEKDYEPLTQNVNVFQMRGTPGQNVLVSIRLKYKAELAPKPGVVNAALAGVPAKALAYFKKASELAAAGDRRAAIEQFTLAIAEHPKFTLAYSDMGVQYLKLGDPERADEAFLAALGIDPDAFAPLMNHGIVLVHLKKYQDAEKVLRDVLAANEHTPAAHYFLGQALAYQGKFDESEKELSTALKTGGPEMNEARRLLAIIYSSRGEKSKMATELEAYLRLAPNAPDAAQLKQAILQAKGAAPSQNPKP